MIYITSDGLCRERARVGFHVRAGRYSALIRGRANLCQLEWYYPYSLPLLAIGLSVSRHSAVVFWKAEEETLSDWGVVVNFE